MLFQGEDASLKLEVVAYEFPADGGSRDSDDRNWLVLRGTYTEEGITVKDTNPCLLTFELRELSAGLKVLRSGVRDSYGSDFVEPYFEVTAESDGEGGFLVAVSFAMPNTMEDLDTAEVECTMTEQELRALIEELDALAEKYPDRV